VLEDRTTTGFPGEEEPCSPARSANTVSPHQGDPGGGRYAPFPLPIGAYLHARGEANAEGGVLQQYSRDGRLLRGRGLPRIGGGKRGKVWGLSDASARRMEFAARNHPRPWLTVWRVGYPGEFPLDGEVCKGHLRSLLMRFRRKYPGGSYLWVQEWQERGALHYHGLFDVEVEAEWLARVWYEIVGSGDENHLAYGTWLEAIRTEDGAIRYLSKYLSKQDQKEVPVGFRHAGKFWGCSRGIAPLWGAWALDGEGCEEASRYMRRLKRAAPCGEHPAPAAQDRKLTRRRRSVVNRIFAGMDGWTAYDAGRHVGRIGDALGIPLDHLGR
jgi:hypothetical protein